MTSRAAKGFLTILRQQQSFLGIERVNLTDLPFSQDTLESTWTSWMQRLTPLQDELPGPKRQGDSCACLSKRSGAHEEAFKQYGNSCWSKQSITTQWKNGGFQVKFASWIGAELKKIMDFKPRVLSRLTAPEFLVFWRQTIASHKAELEKGMRDVKDQLSKHRRGQNTCWDGCEKCHT